MRGRWTGPVATPEILDQKAIVHAWLKTSGGVSPVIDASYGVSSITDVAVGLLDVTWAIPFASAEYTVTGQNEATNAENSAYHKVSNTTPPTTTTCRVSINNSLDAAVDSVGWHLMAYGI